MKRALIEQHRAVNWPEHEGIRNAMYRNAAALGEAASRGTSTDNERRAADKGCGFVAELDIRPKWCVDWLALRTK